MVKMCKYCDYDGYDCNIFYEPLTREWYLELRTDEWDSYNDDFVYMREYITYCPYCGRRLENV